MGVGINFGLHEMASKVAAMKLPHIMIYSGPLSSKGVIKVHDYPSYLEHVFHENGQKKSLMDRNAIDNGRRALLKSPKDKLRVEKVEHLIAQASTSVPVQ